MADILDLPQDLVFVDLETTGGNAAHHRITEVGIVRVESGQFVEEWSSLVNPECRIPAYIEAFTGISNGMVAEAPRFADIAPRVLEKLGSLGAVPGRAPVFVAHNARFDYSFLRMEFRRLGMPFAAKVLCTVKLSRRLFPEFHRHSLDAIMERHRLTCTARHRALGDARVLHEFWSKLRREIPQPQLAAAAHTVLGAGRLPAHLPPDLADELPDGPGVYKFYGEGDVLLYVGKSNSLRTRILSHFAHERFDAKEQKLSRQVRRVDWQETGGELGALLREAQWIKALKPLFNRQLKNKAGAVTLQISGGGESCGRITISALSDVVAGHALVSGITQCFGIFHSEKDARKAVVDIARAQHLCLKVLGLETAGGSCFAYQLGKCKGACVGKEPLLMHGIRSRMALAPLKLKAWPFPGRIALRESGAAPPGDVHVLDQWAYIGTARSDDELARLSAGSVAVAFDADVYRILVRHFAKNPKIDWHDLRDAAASLDAD